METIDFNQVIKDNISVVGELILKDATGYTLEAGVTTLIATRSGVYYICQQDSDTTSLIAVMNYSGVKTFGNITANVELFVSENKLYCTSQKTLMIRVKELAIRY